MRVPARSTRYGEQRHPRTPTKFRFAPQRDEKGDDAGAGGTWCIWVSIPRSNAVWHVRTICTSGPDLKKLRRPARRRLVCVMACDRSANW